MEGKDTSGGLFQKTPVAESSKRHQCRTFPKDNEKETIISFIPTHAQFYTF